MGYIQAPFSAAPVPYGEHSELDDIYLQSGGSASDFDIVVAKQAANQNLSTALSEAEDSARDWHRAWGHEIEDFGLRDAYVMLQDAVLRACEQVAIEWMDSSHERHAIVHESSVNAWYPPNNIIIASAVMKHFVSGAEEFSSAVRENPDLLSPDRSGRKLEDVVRGILGNQGYYTESTAVVGDKGVDIYAWMQSGSRQFILLVQCKNQAAPVSIEIVQRLHGEVSAQRSVDGPAICRAGMVVTTSRFTRPAVRWAEEVGVSLIDQLKLKNWIERYA